MGTPHAARLSCVRAAVTTGRAEFITEALASSRADATQTLAELLTISDVRVAAPNGHILEALACVELLHIHVLEAREAVIGRRRADAVPRRERGGELEHRPSHVLPRDHCAVGLRGCAPVLARPIGEDRRGGRLNGQEAGAHQQAVVEADGVDRDEVSLAVVKPDDHLGDVDAVGDLEHHLGHVLVARGGPGSLLGAEGVRHRVRRGLARRQTELNERVRLRRQ